MSQRKLTKAQIAEAFGESGKQIERYVAEGMPCAGRGQARRFPWPECRNWRDDRIRRMAADAAEKKYKPAGDDELKRARDQRVIVEARLIQMDLAEREAKLVTVEHHEAIVGELADRVRAVLINMPSTYVLHLERLGVKPEQAEVVLEEIATQLTTALRAAADDVELGDDDDDAAPIVA